MSCIAVISALVAVHDVLGELADRGRVGELEGGPGHARFRRGGARSSVAATGPRLRTTGSLGGRCRAPAMPGIRRVGQQLRRPAGRAGRGARHAVRDFGAPGSAVTTVPGHLRGGHPGHPGLAGVGLIQAHSVSKPDIVPICACWPVAMSQVVYFTSGSVVFSWAISGEQAERAGDQRRPGARLALLEQLRDDRHRQEQDLGSQGDRQHEALLVARVAPSPTSSPSMTRSIPTATSSPHGSATVPAGRAGPVLCAASPAVKASWRRP